MNETLMTKSMTTMMMMMMVLSLCVLISFCSNAAGAADSGSLSKEYRIKQQHQQRQEEKFRNVYIRVPVSPSDTIDCTGLSPVSLAGNPAANELVRSYCTGRCAEVTGQSIIPRPATFDFILASIDTVGPAGSLTTLTPIEMLVCGKTLDEVNQLLWPLLIRSGICDTKASCGLDEDVELVNSSTGEISCNQFPDRETANPFALDAVYVAAGVLLIALLLLIAGISCYNVTVTKQKLQFEQEKYIAELEQKLIVSQPRR